MLHVLGPSWGPDPLPFMYYSLFRRLQLSEDDRLNAMLGEENRWQLAPLSRLPSCWDTCLAPGSGDQGPELYRRTPPSKCRKKANGLLHVSQHRVRLRPPAWSPHPTRYPPPATPAPRRLRRHARQERPQHAPLLRLAPPQPLIHAHGQDLGALARQHTVPDGGRGQRHATYVRVRVRACVCVCLCEYVCVCA